MKKVTVVMGMILAGLIFSGQLCYGAEIYGCYNRRVGSLRIVDNLSMCRPDESPISWNHIGPAGPAGPQGPIGPQGTPGPEGGGVLTIPPLATGTQGFLRFLMGPVETPPPTGASTDPNHPGCFDVDGFTFQVLPPAVGASGSAVTDMLVSLPLVPELADVLALARGNPTSSDFFEVDIELCTGTGNSQQCPNFFKLSNVWVGAFSIGPDHAALALRFKELWQTVRWFNPDGSQAGQFELQIVLTSTPHAPTALIPATSTVPSNLQAFLKIQGLTGNSIEEGHMGWSEVSSAMLLFTVTAGPAPNYAENLAASATIAKDFDAMTPSLLRAATGAGGELGWDPAVLDVCPIGVGEISTPCLLRIEFGMFKPISDVLAASVETIRSTFDRFKITLRSETKTKTFGWDLVTQHPW